MQHSDDGRYGPPREEYPSSSSDRVSEEEYGGDRETSASYDGTGKKDALSILLKLAEALEDEGGGGGPRADRSFYGDDGADSQLLGKNGKVDFDNMMLDTFQSGDPKRRLGGLRRVKIAEESSDDEDDDPIYCAAPFNQPDLEAMAVDPSIEPPQEGQSIYPKEADAAIAGGVPYKKFHRKRKANWYGCFCFAAYIVALCVYMYIRASKTLGLGGYLGYGLYVLGVEILGAIATLLYGVNLVWDPVNDPPEMDPQDPNLPLVGMNYHVRVLVPCYREPLSIVSRTILGAHEAVLPNGCQRDIYVCDDGKDPKIRKFCRSLGPSVTYVSGRRREAGEMNGKSGNLNNCLQQIYPEGVPVPPTELVAIFDADQVANTDFFLKMIPLFDGGNDVGMVLSPQCFHNLRLHSDVFNHANIHFWEYAQHGYDALGFISCTGTNFLTRAMAFQEVGWSPTYTLTEDFALGMYMKANKWHCRYVEEYLAIGEAPEQVRNCFQQRSRWCKGHFQVVFSWQHCPLRVKNLNFFHRLLYCSGVFSYIVGAITTPTFIVIPLLTVWFGIFPIVVSWWAALGLTVYAIAQHLVLSYCRRLKHIEALWFSGIANNILWWTFAKAAFNALLAKLGKRVTFKATLKGIGRLADSAVGDLWLPVTAFIFAAVSFGIGLQKLISGPTVITTLSISVAWIVYGMVPPFLLLHYTFIGRGASLAFWSRVMFFVSFLAAACAILLLWFVYPKDFDFGEAAGDSFLFYDAQRVGTLPATSAIPWRSNALTYEADAARGFPDLTGGWLNGGAGGDLKLTMPTAFTTAMLAWGLLAFPSGYSDAGHTEAALDSVRWGTDYLLKIVRPGNIKQTLNTGYTIVYQVGNMTTDIDYWGAPESMTADNMPRPAYLVQTADGASDLAGSLVGAFVSSSLAIRQSNSSDATAYADRLLQTATGLYNEAKAHQGSYLSRLQYRCNSRFAKASIGQKNGAGACPPPFAFANGTAAFYFNSTTIYDDLLWAAGWMYRATGDVAYLADVGTFYQRYQVEEMPNDAGFITDWNHMFQAANVLLAGQTDEIWYHNAVQDMLKSWICALDSTTAFTPQGRAWNPRAPSLGATGNTAMLAALYGQLPSAHIPSARAARYVCFARGQMRYIMGDKTRSLMVGFGRKSPTHVQSRSAACPAPPAACDAVIAQQTLDANPNQLTGAVVEFSTFSDDYKDVRTSNDSRVSIENNAGITGAMAGLITAPGSWDSCLQGFGVLTGDGAVCS